MSRNYRLNDRALILVPLFVALFSVGCNRYTPNRTVIPKEDLATYNPINFSNKGQRSSVKSIKNEDDLIIKAIWYAQQGDYKRSNAYYAKLYELTHNDEYLLKELSTAVEGGFISNDLSKLEAYALKHPDNVDIQRLLISSYLKEKKFDKAKASAQQLISKSKKPGDLVLAANPYSYTGDFPEAVKLLQEAYDKTFNEDVLLNITTILANYMGEVDRTIDLLEKHRASQGCSEKICLQLLDIYLQQRKIDKVSQLYQALYASTRKKVYGEKLVETYLFKKEYKKSIELLKTDYKNNELLYAIYIEMKAYEKANALAHTLLKETKNPKWYAESAMAIYEGASDKKNRAMLSEVVTQFENAFAKGIENSVYLNYYGYTLIDNDIDVNKGIKSIQKALLKEKDNTYYLDSLAWGYYKSDRCDEAYEIMKKVVDVEGLKEKELVEHWSAIQKKCERKIK